MDPVRRSVAFLAVLVTLAGCQRNLIPTPNLYSGTEVNPFAHVPPELASSTVDLLYVTDRAPVPNAAGDTRYGYGRSLSAAFGSCTVEFGYNLSWEDLVAASRTKKRDHAIPLNIRSVTEQHRFPKTPGPIVVENGEVSSAPEYLAARQRGVDAFHDELRRRLALTPRKEVYLYVHGFANDFDHAAYRMAEMWHFLGREGVPLLYSWPAGHPGLLRGYTRDRESGEFTLYHLKECIKALALCPEVEAIHLIAHSRGTDVLMTAMRELIVRTRIAGYDPQQVLKIGNVIMAAPDLDLDVSSQRFSPDRLYDGYELFTIYVTANDRAIGTAEWLFASPRRLGTIQPEDLFESELDRVELLPNVDVIEAKVKTDFTGHGYFLSNPAVFSDVILVLRYDRAPGAANDRPLTPIIQNYYILDDDYPQEAAPPPESRIRDRKRSDD